MDAVVSGTRLDVDQDSGALSVVADVTFVNDPGLNFPRTTSVRATFVAGDSANEIGVKFRQAVNAEAQRIGLPNPASGVGLDVAKLW